MYSDSMTKLEKLEWIHWYLNQILNGTIMLDTETNTAIKFIEEIRDCYIQDYK